MRYTGREGTSHAIVRSLEGGERQWAEAVFEGLMSENFPKPVKKKNNPLFKKKVSTKLKQDKYRGTHSQSCQSNLKAKNKDKILEAVISRRVITCTGVNISCITAGFSIETIEADRIMASQTHPSFNPWNL